MKLSRKIFFIKEAEPLFIKDYCYFPLASSRDGKQSACWPSRQAGHCCPAAVRHAADAPVDQK